MKPEKPADDHHDREHDALHGTGNVRPLPGDTEFLASRYSPSSPERMPRNVSRSPAPLSIVWGWWLISPGPERVRIAALNLALNGPTNQPIAGSDPPVSAAIWRWSVLGLRGERARIRDAARDPRCELALGSQAFRVDSEPALHFATAHLEWSRMRLLEKGVGVIGVYTHHQAALTAGRDGHVSADQKGQATEHPLLGDVGLAGDQLADPISEVFVVRHGGNMVAQGQGRRKRD
jgi:hypothetical protein